MLKVNFLLREDLHVYVRTLGLTKDNEFEVVICNLHKNYCKSLTGFTETEEFKCFT